MISKEEFETTAKAIERVIPLNTLNREELLNLFADSIEMAHTVAKDKWAVRVFSNAVRVTFGSVYRCTLFRDKIWFTLAEDTLPAHTDEKYKHRLERATADHRGWISFALAEIKDIPDYIIQAHKDAYVQADHKWKKLRGGLRHDPAVLEYLRRHLNRPNLPNPGYDKKGKDNTNWQNNINAALRSNGLHFTPWQIATFYTALQTKGFVLLSGISGTGKSKLAQHFAEMLPQPTFQVATDSSEGIIPITVRPYMIKYNRMVIPQSSSHLFTPPPPGETIEINVEYEETSQTCRFAHADYTENNYMQLFLRGGVRIWFQKTFKEDDLVGVEPLIDDQTGELRGFRIFDPDKERKQEAIPNHLFLPVRPDWRDSKSLLGYYNPITERYEWTEFLRFLRQAERSFKARDGMAWFVILDEMNLAHVEYYFADLLSVMESGRDSEGWTREPLRFPRSQDAALDAELPPARMYLPPNLYIVGTVNVDETTHAFSPKVLDRAFTIELNEVDFSEYPVDLGEAEPIDQATQTALLTNFSFDGRFVHRDKAEIADYVVNHPYVRNQLQQLNEVLHPYGRHFGYRVFDEIVSFLAAADHNHLFAALGGTVAAFDAAVLMKVLPKFHGSRNALEAPLRGMLHWCSNSETVQVTSVNEILDKLAYPHDIHKALEVLGDYRYPKTARRVERMLWELYVNGFTAF